MAQRSSIQQTTALQVARLHFLYIAAYVLATIVFDSWNLIPHTGISQRFTAGATLLAVNTAVWHVCRMKFRNAKVYTNLLLVLIISDIIFAGFNVFWERGMASTSAVLFAVPIITAAATRSRSTLLAAATLSTAGYSLAAARYFNLHYGEGFRVQLYGQVGFCCAIFFILAGLLMIIIHPTSDS